MERVGGVRKGMGSFMEVVIGLGSNTAGIVVMWLFYARWGDGGLHFSSPFKCNAIL